MKHALEIRPFDQNYGELADLIQRTWPDEHSSHVEYTPEYLECLISFPDTEQELTLGAYVNGKLVSFLLSKKKEVVIRQKSYYTVFYTLATTDSAFASLFPYLKIKDACVKHAIRKGFDLSCGYAAWGIRNNEIEQLYAQRKGFHCTRIHSFGTFVRDLESGPEGPSEICLTDSVSIREFAPEDLPQCLDLVTEGVSATCTMFEKLEAAAFLRRLTPSEYMRTLVVVSDGRVLGFVNYTVLTLLYKNFSRKTAIIYNLFLQHLSCEQKTSTLHTLCEKLKQEGVEGMSLPNTGYFPVRDVKKLGFMEIPFKSGKTNFYLTAFHEQLDLTCPCPFYMEII